MNRATTILCLAAFLALAAQPALSQERTYTIAIYAPSLLFPDSAARNHYIQQVASGLESRTGLPFKGVGFAKAGDLKKQVKKGEVDFAIVDTTYYLGHSGMTPIASCSGPKGTAIKLQVVSSSNVTLSDLRGKALTLPNKNSSMLAFITNQVLGKEIAAEDFFEVSSAKDANTALSQVKSGKADLTVVYSTYAQGAGLSVLMDLAAMPLPIVVVVNDDVPEEVRAQVSSSIKGLSVSGAQVLSGFSSYDSGAVKAYKGNTGTKKKKKKPYLTTERTLKIETGGIPLKDVEETLNPAPVIPLLVLPPIDD